MILKQKSTVAIRIVADEVSYLFADMLTEVEKNNLVAFLLTQ